MWGDFDPSLIDLLKLTYREKNHPETLTEHLFNEKQIFFSFSFLLINFNYVI